jgi:hypothetical protein
MPLHADEGEIPMRPMPFAVTEKHGPTKDKTITQSQRKWQSLKVESSERRIGPLNVDGKYFTVLLKVKKIFDPRVVFHETVESFEIKDKEGNTHYQRSYEATVGEYGFRESVSVDGYVLEGRYGRGLILYYGIDPSAPSSGVSCQIFALKDGRLVAVSLPLAVYGKIYDLPKGSSENSLRLFNGDLLKFGVWTGNYQIIVPILIDWRRVAIRPFPHNLGDFKVEAEREPVEEETFVRLFQVRDLSTVPKHVVIKKETKVEFLYAYTKIILETSFNQLVISAHEPWLKVRINGKGGWVKEASDLNALGLPDAG